MFGELVVTAADRRAELRKHLLKPPRKRKKPQKACVPLPTMPELAAAFQACQERALAACQHFISLLHRFRSMLIAGLIRDRGLHEQDAEDAVASAITKTYEEVLAGTCELPRRNWYLKLHYRARTFGNLLRRHRSSQEALAVHSEGFEASASYDPTLHAEFVDFVAHVAEGMTLKRRAILWAWVQGASAAEIAEVLRTSRDAIHTAISRLRARLRLEFPEIARNFRREKRA